MAIPIDETGCFRFYVPLSARAGSVQADEFLFGKTQAETAYPPGTKERASLEAVAGSLVWLGTDDQASRLLKLPDGNTASVADLTTRALAAIHSIPLDEHPSLDRKDVLASARAGLDMVGEARPDGPAILHIYPVETPVGAAILNSLQSSAQ